jgi:CheY-like chemotaxis protein
VSKERLILLVEDAEEDGFLFMQAVKRAGLGNPVRVVRDGQEALGYLSGAFFYADRERFPLPCILMLDLKLPRKSGWEVLEWVRARREFQGMLVVVLTASDNISDLHNCYRMGANSFLTKPCNAEDLRNLAKAFPEHFGTLPTLKDHLAETPISKAGGGPPDSTKDETAGISKFWGASQDELPSA